MSALQSLHTLLLEPLLPFQDRRRAGPQLPLDFAITHPLSQRQDQPRPEYLAGGRASRLRLFPQLVSFVQDSPAATFDYRPHHNEVTNLLYVSLGRATSTHHLLRKYV
jgi:hypothetical protein